MACPASVRHNAGKPNISTEYAAEGSAAHELGARCLQTFTMPHEYAGQTIRVEPNFEFEVDDEMIEAVDVYVRYVRSLLEIPHTTLTVEKAFSLEIFDPRFFGRNDAAVYNARTKTLYVVDYKHGRGKGVSVENNAQLKYYALGALLTLDAPVEKIVLSIVQPRFGDGEPCEWTTDCNSLLGFAAELIEAAKATDDPNAPFVTGDEQCLFCAGAATCPARIAEAYETAGAVFDKAGAMTLSDPADIGDNHMAVLLERAQRIEDWVSAVRARAHAMAEEGRPPAGWKLVDKRARRKWMIDDAALPAALAERGITGDAQYTRKLVSPAQAESLIGKAAFKKKFGSDMVDSVSSGTVLAPIDDPRPAAGAKRDADALFR